MTVRSSTFTSSIGQSSAAFATGVNNLLAAFNPISILSASLTVGDERAGLGLMRFSVQFQTPGLAAYQANSLIFDGTAGTTFNAQVNAFFQTNANLFPRYFFDVTSREDRSLRRALIVISEFVEDAPDDGSYAVGDMGILNRHSHIVEADANIAAGASGLVSFYSPGGRTLQTTGINRGPAALSTGDRAYAIVDPISQSIYVYPTCC